MSPHDTLKNYVNILLSSNTTSLIIKGSAGLGKTHTILKTLEENGIKEGVGYIYITGFITPLELFNTLSKASVLDQPKLFVFDDLEGIINNKLSVGLLKSALWEARGKRVVNYQSSTSKLEDTPKSFEFDGKVIIVVNSMKEENTLGRSLRDRSIFYNMQLSSQELTTYIEQVIPEIEPELSMETKSKIWDKIKRFSVVQNFSLRSVSRAFQFHKHSEENWLDLFLNTLELSREQKVFHSLLELPIPEGEKAKQFKDSTGLSTKTFNRWKTKTN